MLKIGISGYALTGVCMLISAQSALAEHASPTVSRKALNLGGSSKGFLTAQLQKGMREAVDEVLGVGHGVNQQSLEAIRRTIEPMWAALHKMRQGRVDRRSFRFVVQDFFLQRHHLSITGLEVNLASDTTSEAALLTDYAPNYVKTVLEGDNAGKGFLIEDAVTMIAALRRLIEHTGSNMLEDAYKSTGVDISMDIDRQTMFKVMEAYVLRWMMGEDQESIQMLEANESLKSEAFDDWHELVGLAQGHVRQFEYVHQNMPKFQTGKGWNAFRPHFSFADAQSIVGVMALSFGHFWETECAAVKKSLVKMDSAGNGRIKLSDFHGSALNGEWRFSESREYLKQMGALDETSSWQGPRVIITNYLQAPSNCIISTEHYRVCCANECQEHLDELEETIGGAFAPPEDIFPIIERLHSGLDDEPNITETFKEQLDQIAQSNDGKVPIHGRLFAQWMHFVFPHECPFPHKSGTTSTLTPLAYGDDFMATQDEMVTHTKEALAKVIENNATVLDSAVLENEWKSQWSDEEELLTNHAGSSWGQVEIMSSVFGMTMMISVGFLLVKAGIISPTNDKQVTSRFIV